MQSTKFPAAYSGCGGSCGWYVFKFFEFFWTCRSEAPHGCRDIQVEISAGEIQDKTSEDIDIHPYVQLSV